MTTPSERAKDLFDVYEAAFPDPNVRRRWSDLTRREQRQWMAVEGKVAEAVRAEREECARIAEGPGGFDVDNNDQLQARIASAIRARTPASGEEGA